MDSLSREIRSIAVEAGADLVGFAPVERFATGPEETRPEYFLCPQTDRTVYGPHRM